VHDSSGYHNYNRLLQIRYQKNGIHWSVLGDIPPAYWSYNWEGIAFYKNGYFLVNDKYTDKRPYRSVLLYLHH
jgi:hypothetical protein